MATALLALSPVLIAALFGACGGDRSGGIQEPGPLAAVTITAPTTMIRVGETVQLTATARDADGTVLEGHDFEWTSGIGTVASVSPTGLVTGLVKGQSKIRATTEGVTGSIVITVAVDPRPDPVTMGHRSAGSPSFECRSTPIAAPDPGSANRGAECPGGV